MYSTLTPTFYHINFVEINHRCIIIGRVVVKFKNAITLGCTDFFGRIQFDFHGISKHAMRAFILENQ